jgi:predicted permease
MLRDLSFRLRALFRKRTVEEELDEELSFHLERQAEKYMAAGATRQAAVRRARLELGGVSTIKEECRDARGVRVVEELVQDLRYGVRKLRASPGFTAVALVTLALGIGANTALFSVMSGVLLSPLPYREPERLVTLHASKPNFPTGSISYPNFRDWRTENRTFESMAIHRGSGFSLTGAGTAEWVDGRMVSAEFFSLLGVEPILGRTFVAGEDEIGASPVAVISERLWRRKFDATPDILGRTIVLDGRGYSVVGVVPSSFNLFQSTRARDVHVPIGQGSREALLDRSVGLGLHGIGRLAPGVSIAQAQVDLDRVAGRLAEVHPETNRGMGAAVIAFKERLVGSVRPVLLVLFGAVGFVLLIACANVANLLLARATGRARELAVRAAVGASRGRLVRQLLTESALLALVGGALGLLVAAWITPAVVALMPDTLPRAAMISVDGRVLVFSLVLSLLCGLLFGLAPALKATEVRLHGALKDGGRSVRGASHRAQDILVVVQIALVLVLLVGAGLMIRTLSRLWTTDPGFEPAGVSSFGLTLPPSLRRASPAAVRAHPPHVEARVKGIPGVAAVSLSTNALPFTGSSDERLFWLDRQPRPATTSEMQWAIWYAVGTDYLPTMGIPLLAGRFLGPQESRPGPLAVAIDEVFARRYFGAADPIGRHIHVDGIDVPAQIVGVVGHVKQWGLQGDDAAPVRAQIYFSFMQYEDTIFADITGLDVLVRSSGSSPVPFQTIRAALQEMDPEHVLFAPQTMEQAIADSLGQHRFSMLLLSGFAALALVLASVGIYGVVSYSVGQRTGEIGVRIALGARRGDVLRLVLGEGLRIALVGIAIGVIAALALTRLMAHLLHGVSPTDPLTFVAVASGLAAVALAACYLPARRATRVEPMVALRHE